MSHFNFGNLIFGKWDILAATDSTDLPLNHDNLVELLPIFQANRDYLVAHPGLRLCSEASGPFSGE